MAIPDIPGSSLDAAYEREKIRQVANLMKVKHHRFPGAQPISFSNEHFSELENENYFVSEKADGIRCFLFVCKNVENKMEAFLIDRKNKLNMLVIYGFLNLMINTFRKFHDNTIIYLTNYILNPYKKYLQYNPEYAKNVPFSVKLKKLHLSHRMNDVFEEQKLLKHKSDGLIFTSESSPYISGNCNKMLKWKPIRENSIDFKVHYIKEEHRFTLNIWGGEKNHFYYADLTIDNPEMQKEWEKNPPEGKIIECYFENNCWHFMRFREDKENANHESIVKKIIKSIEDNVESDELLEHTQIIRNNWKHR
ncbi:DNA ligase/mRNA capping enzyme [Neocallimastix californiae]|uniref:mRNA guanylyltransferase n=1 Tax=Neocallimastix californiae TaxID=1754190 RepID=A0A1Y2FTC4_9FUNG|nr:DNA ligase/mRNA capping enzyme [Neocallimastix californiae]|eukprot:ORY86554.1 DNA ligase/mRNA capping enzyme [Neocallimastix californiae]